MSKWNASDGTPLEFNPNDPEEVRRWHLRNLDRFEDEIAQGGKVPGREGLHLMADLQKEWASDLRSRLEKEWSRATGGESVPPEAATPINSLLAQQNTLAEAIHQQATAATDMEVVGATTAIDGLRSKRKRKVDGTNGGKADKRTEWAERLAIHLIGLELSFPEAWDKIPVDEYAPLRLDEDTAVYRTERGKKVVAFDPVNGGEIGRPQSLSNFEKRYFRRARGESGQ